MLLRKSVYLHEYMYNWKIFDETSLPDKEALYSELNVKDITDKVFNEFRLKNLGGYHTYMFKVIHYCLQMYLKTLEIDVLMKYITLIHLIFYPQLD